MSRLEDSTPEEMKPEYEQMIAFLRAFSKTPPIDSVEDQAQAMERIQQRLTRTLLEHQYEESMAGSGLRQGSNLYPKPTPIRALHPFINRLSLLAAVLVVAVLVGSTVLVLNLVRQQRTAAQEAMQPGNVLPPRIYVTGPGIACLDGRTGTVLWHYSESTRLPSGFSSTTRFWTPVVTGDSVYAVANPNEQGGDIYAFNAQSGKIRWKRALDTNHGVNQPLLVDGILYVNAVDSTDPAVKNHQVYVYALNPLNGSIEKHYSVATTPAGYAEDMIHSTIANGILYITTSNTIHAFNLSTGTQIWQQPEHLVQKFFSVQVVQGIVYTSSFEMFVEGQPEEGGGHAYAYDARTGKLLWRSASIASSADAPLAVAGQNVYINAYTGLLALDRRTGKERWNDSVATPGFPVFLNTQVPPLLDGNAVYVTQDSLKQRDNTIVALNATNGSRLWKQPPHFQVIQAANGIIYAADQQENIVALRASDRAQLWKVQISKPAQNALPASYNEAIVVP